MIEPMKVLVLGGSRFVGRSLVEASLGRGDDVTVVNRGVSSPHLWPVRHLVVDRTDARALGAVLADQEWDVVVDTWAGAPEVVLASARVLKERVGHYAYVSSRSVYRWPLPVGVDETAPLVDGDPEGRDHTDYAAAKRGGELAVLEHFGDRSLLARAGLILGPYEDVGRLPWWLDRVRAGGLVPAPGPRDRPLQYIDTRDLAAWMLAASQVGLTGAFNAVSRPGHTTIGELLAACIDAVGLDARLAWLSPELLQELGVTGWTDLPIWVPPSGEMAGLHGADVSAAHDNGLVCRSVEETVRDTWLWWRTLDALPDTSLHRVDGPSEEIDAALKAAAASLAANGG